MTNTENPEIDPDHRSYQVVTSDGVFSECAICHALLDGADELGYSEEVHYAEEHPAHPSVK